MEIENSKREEEEEGDTDEEKRESELPNETPSSKEKEKILEDEELESYWEEDVDAVIKQTISKVARTEEVRSNMRDLIASITTEEPATTKLAPAVTQQAPTKSPAIAPKISSKRKGAQTSRGATAPEEPKHIETSGCKILDKTVKTYNF